MKAKVTFRLATLIMAGALASACGSSKQATTQLGSGVDSIKVEVSTPVSSSHVLLANGNKALVRMEGRQETTLSNKESKKLNVLACNLFVKATSPIIVSEEKASGRTCNNIFTVTLYRNGKGESKRYAMGDEDNGITRCTTKNIRYSDTFREFMFAIFNILK